MGYNDDDGFEFEDENQNDQSGSALRKARDEAAKKARDLETELATVKAQLTERNLQDVLQEEGLHPGLAKWISKDGIDATDKDAVMGWVKENAELIGYQPKTPEGQDAPDERAAEFARMQQVGANALPVGKYSEAQTALANLKPDATVEEVNAILRGYR